MYFDRANHGYGGNLTHWTRIWRWFFPRAVSCMKKVKIFIITPNTVFKITKIATKTWNQVKIVKAGYNEVFWGVLLGKKFSTKNDHFWGEKRFHKMFFWIFRQIAYFLKFWKKYILYLLPRCMKYIFFRIASF